MKVHVITDLNGNPIDFLLTKANVDDRDVLYEFASRISIHVLRLCCKITLKRGNSKYTLPKPFRNMISKFRRRIKTTFHQLIEHFDIERVRANSIIGVSTNISF